MNIHRGLGIALIGAGLGMPGCSADRAGAEGRTDAGAGTAASNAESLVESGAASSRIAELRARFRLRVRASDYDRPGVAAHAAPLVPTTLPALGAPVATRFEAAAGPDAATHVRAVLPGEALAGVARPARVALPVRADGEVKLEDQTSRVSVDFALEHVRDTQIEVAGGVALYRGALGGADVVHRVHAEGTEDFVVFETRPAREELSYSVDVSRVSGLRLVSNTLEFLEDSGTPVLRVAPPYVVDATGGRHDATLAVAGCAYDASPAAPWGRQVTRPGATRCTVLVTWGGIAYPAMVDPMWSATGTMATARTAHSASLLPASGRVLFAGGLGATGALASAELYDPAGNAGAGTFAATGSLAVARGVHAASVLPSGKVLLVGGRDSTTIFASAELYDPAGNAGAGTFAVTGSMATVRWNHTASVLPSGKVLVAGGCTTPGSCSPILASAELFDPAADAGAGAFAVTGSMGAARAFHAAGVLASGKVLVVGGAGDGPLLSSAELFDPGANAGAGAFAATGSMAGERFYFTASVLPSGKVLVAGGMGSGTSLASAELFDPAGNAGAGTFAAAGAMVSARFLHTASVLASGKVLVAGGCSTMNTCAPTLSGAELFDPTGNAGVGTFAAAPPMAVARQQHSAAVLPSGKVLVAGGASGPNLLNGTAELFSFVVAHGGACTAGGDCLSGFCVDGVCCDSACNGTCQACAATLKQSGIADGTCGTAKDGLVRGGQVCGPPSATCDGDHTTTGADGTRDCAPYKCDVGGTCRAACATSSDCVAPAVCGANGRCSPPAPATASDGGCNVGAGDEPSRLAWLAAAAGLALVAQRRRSRAQ